MKRGNRKKRAMPEDLASAEAVSGWEETSSNTLHKASPKGITCLDLHPSQPNLVRVFLFGVRRYRCRLVVSFGGGGEYGVFLPRVTPSHKWNLAGGKLDRKGCHRRTVVLRVLVSRHRRAVDRSTWCCGVRGACPTFRCGLVRGSKASFFVFCLRRVTVCFVSAIVFFG